MKMYENRLKNLFRNIVGMWIFLFATTSVVLIVAMPKDSAHSMVIVNDSSVSNGLNSPSLSTVQAIDKSDLCLPLIHSRRTQNNNNNSVHASNQIINQTGSTSIARAGTTAAIALMLGARYAISPLDKDSDYDVSDLKVMDEKSVGDDVPRTTLSISAYRQCKKELALKALNNR